MPVAPVSDPPRPFRLPFIAAPITPGVARTRGRSFILGPAP